MVAGSHIRGMMIDPAAILRIDGAMPISLPMKYLLTYTGVKIIAPSMEEID